MILVLDVHAMSMWVYPINNLRFEESEYSILYCNLSKYRDKFYGWYRMTTRKFDELLEIVESRGVAMHPWKISHYEH